jgi:hypothetical protein
MAVPVFRSIGVDKERKTGTERQRDVPLERSGSEFARQTPKAALLPPVPAFRGAAQRGTAILAVKVHGLEAHATEERRD